MRRWGATHEVQHASLFVLCGLRERQNRSPAGVVLYETRPIAGVGGGTRTMAPKFVLELYYEQEDDRCFAEEEAKKLKSLVHCLAPHILLDVHVLKATTILRNDDPCDHPYHEPSCPDRQSLLITNDSFCYQGLAGRGRGCLSKKEMEKKARKGENSADITIHEWLHTIQGQEVNGRCLPNPHCAPPEFSCPDRKGPDGQPVWYRWYKHILR